MIAVDAQSTSPTSEDGNTGYTDFPCMALTDTPSTTQRKGKAPSALVRDLGVSNAQEPELSESIRTFLVTGELPHRHNILLALVQVTTATGTEDV